MGKKLSDKQETFCQEYITDLNATQAAIRAGYSFDSARQIATNLLSKVYIQARIAELNKDRAEATGITQKRVLEEFAKIAFFDVRKIYSEDGALLPINQISDKEAGAISSIKTQEDGEFGEIKDVKIFDKIRALESLAKHLGMYEKDNEQSKQVTDIKTKIVFSKG